MSDPASAVWQPRASSLGSYFLCEYRAALDRAMHYGLIEKSEEEPDTKYADFGTCCHWRTQELIDAKFTEGAEPPTAEQLDSASQLYGGDRAACRDMVERVSERAALRLATVGKSWLAETEWVTPVLTGHIDFLSPDGAAIVDLKTTSRKPNHNRVKASHLYQLIAYYILSGKKAEKGYVLYADAQKAGWTLLCPIEYNSAAMHDLVKHTEAFIMYLHSRELGQNCVPHLGNHCSDEYCPHRTRCKDRYIPLPGDLDETKETVPIIYTPRL